MGEGNPDEATEERISRLLGLLVRGRVDELPGCDQELVVTAHGSNRVPTTLTKEISRTGWIIANALPRGEP